jgi:hypothetical protein
MCLDLWRLCRRMDRGQRGLVGFLIDDEGCIPENWVILL